MPLRLTKESYDTLRRGILDDLLPLTFKHPVEVARQFNVKYLRIDCLCIFQDPDEKQNWLTKASLIGKIYSHTLLNLSAARARDPSEGMFAERDGTTEVLPIVLPQSMFGS